MEFVIFTVVVTVITTLPFIIEDLKMFEKDIRRKTEMREDLERLAVMKIDIEQYASKLKDKQ